MSMRELVDHHALFMMPGLTGKRMLQLYRIESDLQDDHEQPHRCGPARENKEMFSQHFTRVPNLLYSLSFSVSVVSAF